MGRTYLQIMLDAKDQKKVQCKNCIHQRDNKKCFASALSNLNPELRRECSNFK